MNYSRKANVLLGCAALAFGGGNNAHATGVSAGTLIQNTATATYGSGNSQTTVTSNTVSIRVDELLNVSVSSLDAAPIQLASSAILTYRLDNSGNGSEAFSINASSGVSGNGFDPLIQSIAIDSNDNGLYDPGADLLITNGSTTPALAPDASTRIFVIVSQPSTTVDGTSGQVRLVAQALTGSGSPGTNFAGQGQGGGDAIVGATSASASALGTVTASSASVTLAKSYAIQDPFGGATPVPGAIVTFSITAAASGSGSVSDLHVVDTIPAGTSYIPSSLTLDGAPLTDVADGDAGVASAAGIDVAFDSMAGGNSHTVTFKTSIN